MAQKIVTQRSLHNLKEAAKKYNTEILETTVAYYFRVFENKNCTHLHIIYKKDLK